MKHTMKHRDLKSRMLALLLALVFVFSLVPAGTVKADSIYDGYLPFADVNPNHWGYEPMKYAYVHGIITGYESGLYGADDNLTRAQFAAMLCRINGDPGVVGTVPFTDVKESDWFHRPAVWAYQNDIIHGTSETTFAPNNNITRQEIAVMLCNYAKKFGYDCSDTADISGYTDAKKVSKWATGSLEWAIAAGILKGKNVSNVRYLAPLDNATRAEAATMLQRFCGKYGISLPVKNMLNDKLGNDYLAREKAIQIHQLFKDSKFSELWDNLSIDEKNAMYTVAKTKYRVAETESLSAFDQGVANLIKTSRMRIKDGKVISFTVGAPLRIDEYIKGTYDVKDEYMAKYMTLLNESDEIYAIQVELVATDSNGKQEKVTNHEFIRIKDGKAYSLFNYSAFVYQCSSYFDKYSKLLDCESVASLATAFGALVSNTKAIVEYDNFLKGVNNNSRVVFMRVNANGAITSDYTSVLPTFLSVYRNALSGARISISYIENGADHFSIVSENKDRISIYIGTKDNDMKWQILPDTDQIYASVFTGEDSAPSNDENSDELVETDLAPSFDSDLREVFAGFTSIYDEFLAAVKLSEADDTAEDEAAEVENDNEAEAVNDNAAETVNDSTAEAAVSDETEAAPEEITEAVTEEVSEAATIIDESAEADSE